MNEKAEFGGGAALVIGGSGGIGAAICESLAQRGSNVALTYRSNLAAAEEIASRVSSHGAPAHILKLNIEDAADVK